MEKTEVRIFFVTFSYLTLALGFCCWEFRLLVQFQAKIWFDNFKRSKHFQK
jgi:hypothetical protein